MVREKCHVLEAHLAKRTTIEPHFVEAASLERHLLKLRLGERHHLKPGILETDFAEAAATEFCTFRVDLVLATRELDSTHDLVLLLCDRLDGRHFGRPGQARLHRKLCGSRLMQSVRQVRLDGQDEADLLLFIADLETIAAADEDRLEAILDVAERERRDNLELEHARRLFSISHGLMRHAVAVRLGLPLEDVSITGGIGVKPRLIEPTADLDISMSHSGRFAACAVTLGGRVGVDLEIMRDDRIRRIAPMLDAEEQAWLAEEAEDPRRAIAIWTLKEAVAKATGQGLRLDFASFSVAADPPRVLRPPPHFETGWRLWQLSHKTALVAVAWCAGS